jgi:type VI secretion system protein ImpM
MRCGLFGKLPSKRDFIAPYAPRRFLDVWEPWMQGALAASRQSLGERWQEAFLKAPIWRFWLGADLCGATVAGAFMSSLDRVGRYFPLTVFAFADEDPPIPPPELEPHDTWFAAAEEFLLSTLDENVSFEAVSAELDRLPAPPEPAAAPCSDNVIKLPDGTVAIVHGWPGGVDTFASIRRTDHAAVYAAATFWWTTGGEGYRPIALGSRRMPNPFLFTQMLTGDFSAAGI